jgi:flap endonuclease-1
VIDLKILLKELNWSQEQLIDFAILSGTDYNSNPKGVGPVTAFKMIDELESIDNILEDEKLTSKFDWSAVGNYEVIRENFRSGW